MFVTENTRLLLYVGGVCAITLKIESVKTEIVPLRSCNKDISGNHKFSNKLNESELELIICRAAKGKVCAEGFSTRIKDGVLVGHFENN